MAQNDNKKYPFARNVVLQGNLAGDPRHIPGKEGNDGAGFTIFASSTDHTGFKLDEPVDGVIFGYWGRALMDNFGRGDRIQVVGDLFFDEYTQDTKHRPEGDLRIRIEAYSVAEVVYPKDKDDNDRGSRRGRDRGDDEGSERGSRRSSSRDGGDGERGSRRSSSRGDSDDAAGGDEGTERGSRRSSSRDGGGRSSRSSRSSRDRGDTVEE